MTYFLRWNLESLRSHIYFLINIHTGDDKEDPGTPGPSCQQPAQPEDDGSLVLLDDLHHEYEAEREGGHYQHQREDGESQGADPRSLLTG